jgi:hypothetical protein
MLTLTEKIKAYRVKFIVDDDTLAFLGKYHGYQESDELWYWEDTEEIQYEVFKPCEDCGSRSMMESYACPTNGGYCTDCCYCEEHFPEYYDQQLEIPYED